MAREKFYESLRRAAHLLAPVRPRAFARDEYDFDPADGSGTKRPRLPGWFAVGSVAGFDPADHADRPPEEQGELTREIAAFEQLVRETPPDASPSEAALAAARRHLENVQRIVRERLLPEWLTALHAMMETAADAVRGPDWYIQKDEKELTESLLGKYRAPRLRLRSLDREVVLDPVAYFGSGKQGVVHLVAMPTYETAYLITLKSGKWRIESLQPGSHRRPLSKATLLKTLAGIPRLHESY